MMRGDLTRFELDELYGKCYKCGKLEWPEQHRVVWGTWRHKCCFAGFSSKVERECNYNDGVDEIPIPFRELGL
jgi:hypothetical protein